MKTQIQRSKGSVRYAFKDSLNLLEKNKTKQSLIYLFFTYGNKRFKYSIGFKSCYAHWDLKKQRIKNISSILNKDEVNDFLNEYEDNFLKRYRVLYAQYGDAITNSMLKDELDIIIRKKSVREDETTKKLTFFDVCNKFIDDKGTSIAPVTKRVYKQAITILEKYEKETNVKLTFETIDITFYNSFKAFLEKEKYSLNTIGKHIKTLKSFLNYAFIENYTKSLKFKSKDFKVEKEITTQIYLNDSEIESLFKKDYSKLPILEHVRDVFLMGCYTGQRVSDYNNLTSNDIITKEGIQYFKFVQQKNRKKGKIIYCPITKEMRVIMNRYNGNPPPALKEQYINLHIKDIGFELEFNELIKCEYTKGGKLITKMIPKYNLIKTHTARRSFCTNKYKAGMNVFDIMLFSGHSTEKEFYKYIRIKDEERASHIVKSGFFNV
ncbi:site-specific integrase [Lutibacter sp.]|uniref:tyrosine-type recombinase/integrase n=1 Tax=Lutibacter sp. TaxID=1925666 RepID=UPI0025C11C6B|nr:site-specific integrase [Lutibacter sp.]MCF6168245.1 site-specific integrase [Lutibacter sp.]